MSSYVLSADVASVGKKRLRVFEEDSKTAFRRQTVDTAALEHIFASCSAEAVKDVENILLSLEQDQQQNQQQQQQGAAAADYDPTSRILLRYAVLSDAHRRERQSNEILTGALQASLRAVEEARDELSEVKAERDALRRAVQEQQFLVGKTPSPVSRRVL